MLNIEKYKDDILNLSLSDLTCCVNNLAYKGQCITKCRECKKYAMEWLLSEYKEPVLDEVEKSYLSAVIEPFRKKIAYIVKLQDFIEGKQFIKIILQNDDRLSFPYFDYDSMYKGMDTNKRYSLKELVL
jgi:hypothetical protein